MSVADAGLAVSDDARRRPRILVFYDRPGEVLPCLEARHPTARFSTCTSYAALPAALAATCPDIVLAAKFEPAPFPRAALLSCASLRWLSVAFAGIDHVVPWDPRQLVVTNASGVAAEDMAQYVIAAIFGLYQRFPHFAQRQAEHHWDYQLVRSARGATIGLVGLGHTGEAIARLCRQVGLRVVACRARPQPSPLVDKMFAADALHDMLREVDVVVLCAALTPTTRDLFDETAFAAMKPGSALINVARGAMLIESALIAALRSGHLSGAVIDVARTEPLPNSDPLWDAVNLLITPHTSSEYVGWITRAAEMFSDNLARWMAGMPLKNEVFSDRGY